MLFPIAAALALTAAPAATPIDSNLEYATPIAGKWSYAVPIGGSE